MADLEMINVFKLIKVIKFCPLAAEETTLSMLATNRKCGTLRIPISLLEPQKS